MNRRPNTKIDYIILPRLASFDEHKNKSNFHDKPTSEEISFKFTDRSITSMPNKPNEVE